MSFVKDDHGYTRGVGAVAAMDAASPGRRLAAARAARELARRDRLMAASTLGRIRQDGEDRGGGGGGHPAPHGRGPQPRPGGPSSEDTARGPRGSGRPTHGKPPGHHGKPHGKPARFGKGGLIDAGILVKSPGSVLDTGMNLTKGSETKGAATKEPTRSYGGGGGGSSGGANVGPLEPLPLQPEEEETQPAPTVVPVQKPANLLLYAAVGVAGWWLLTRK